MNLNISAHLAYSVPRSCDVILQMTAAQTDGQRVSSERLVVAPNLQMSYIEAEDGVGCRIVFHASDRFEFTYRAAVKISRASPNFTELNMTPMAALPSEVIKYLMPSRYCDPDPFEKFVTSQFEGQAGGARIEAMSSWIGNHFQYRPGSSQSHTSAIDSFNLRQGVCRDYAHTLIAMARAAGIPARMVSAYAPNVQPPDFHAAAEVYLDNAWHLVDPTQMASAEDIAIIGVGRDAADVSFLTSFGDVELIHISVDVEKTT